MLSKRYGLTEYKNISNVFGIYNFINLKGYGFVKKSTCFLLTALFFLLGMVAGFLAAPVKGGVNIGNNSGNTYASSDDVDNYDSDY